MAKLSGLAINTIRNFENNLISPRSDTVSCLCKTFEKEGLEFLDSDGVRERNSSAKSLEKQEDLECLFSNMLHMTITGKCNEIVAIVDTEEMLLNFMGDKKNWIVHLSEFVSIKCILLESRSTTANAPNIHYRDASQKEALLNTFLVFGSKYIMITGYRPNKYKLLLCDSAEMAFHHIKKFHQFGNWQK